MMTHFKLINVSDLFSPLKRTIFRKKNECCDDVYDR